MVGHPEIGMSGITFRSRKGIVLEPNLELHSFPKLLKQNVQDLVPNR
jgi:hypothetical protein